jgi:hypothetical protein
MSGEDREASGEAVWKAYYKCLDSLARLVEERDELERQLVTSLVFNVILLGALAVALFAKFRGV